PRPLLHGRGRQLGPEGEVRGVLRQVDARGAEVLDDTLVVDRRLDGGREVAAGPGDDGHLESLVRLDHLVPRRVVAEPAERIGACHALTVDEQAVARTEAVHRDVRVPDDGHVAAVAAMVVDHDVIIADVTGPNIYEL